MKRTIANITAALVALAPTVAQAQSASQRLPSLEAYHQCTQELEWNARSSPAPIAASAFWYAPSLRRAVIAFERKPSTPGPWKQIQASNCVSGQSRSVWTREW